jgi:hypothetical protein
MWFENKLYCMVGDLNSKVIALSGLNFKLAFA